jgi:hypothetical protein
MSAQAVPIEGAQPLEQAVPAVPRVRGGRIRHRREGLVSHLPGPEALLHPSAAEALILAFRPLSWGR